MWSSRGEVRDGIGVREYGEERIAEVMGLMCCFVLERDKRGCYEKLGRVGSVGDKR